ncbi:uncharacterized protein LOC121857753 isoform X1 [Homarus americanus]|uniref:Copper transport protein n=1 Tax=Homarus americanus TaxID=6706 RepID=A0A8J5MJ92_HOMAM|nr:uncharacterized protein LOC121857753 isoform X1 [Homarus americanus]XP_042209823.1 uncharacterized protein LOC121857753 isoform X1 [Homarus americanus]XP_042209824.1 uncharacterized protein LOC121857753 isoform X1 [Homarus americanus]XP_042209825.1 uncharacterized protein LOC121857753 isoform X1 [Homarus americanus]KAG7153277.1 High affinity copper uptake protein 1-like 1 [Homarus americanus]
MHMSYFFSSTVYDFLFKGVNIVTTWGMVSLCLGLVSLSVLAEGFKVARSQLLKVATSRRTGCSKYEIPERSPLLMSESFLGRRNQKLLYKRRVKFHILQSFFHVLHLIIGYILMLVVMTYNAYFTIAVVAGAGLGYFFFAVFDLPSKLLGSYHSPLPKDPPNFTCGSEGNASRVRNSYGTSETVPSSVVLRPSSGFERYSRNVDSMDLAFENTRGEVDDTRKVAGHDGAAEGVEKLVGGSSEEHCEARNNVEVDVSDTSHLLPQETIKVEVQVHAYPEE